MKPYELTIGEIIEKTGDFGIGYKLFIAHEAQKKLLEYIKDKVIGIDVTKTSKLAIWLNCNIEKHRWQSLLKDFDLGKENDN